VTRQPPHAAITIEIPANTSVILRVVPDPPTAPADPADYGAAAGAALAAHVTAFLGLREARPPHALPGRQVFRPGSFLPELANLAEVLIVEPHHDPTKPNQRYAGWAADITTPDRPITGVWYGATPMTVLACLVDALQQYLLAQRAKEQRGAS
jgi:hypothetical protein